MKLAQLGGPPVIAHSPLSYQWVSAVSLTDLWELINSQLLSGFLAQPGSSYFGGKYVLQLEDAFRSLHSANFAVSFNSWTSGLEAIFTSLDLKPGDEVIVPSWTMSGTVAAIALSGASPVFCDISPDTFTISPDHVSSLITPKTRAVCGVDIFGRPADWRALQEITQSKEIYLVADSAQAPGAKIDQESPSAIADVGGFSLNRHKHIQSGEGGMAITNNARIAKFLQALRNHGEVAAPEVELKHKKLFGHNWRLGEIEALLAFNQVKNFDEHLESRRRVAKYLIEHLNKLEGIDIPNVPNNYVHDYYILGLKYDSKKTGVSRDRVLNALRAEGINFALGYYCDIQKLPAFSDFRTGSLKNTEFLNSDGFLGLYLCGYQFDHDFLEKIVEAFQKVWACRSEILA
jgi:dTDP-4-amino-4,6-dideoxygalactose transaminase